MCRRYAAHFSCFLSLAHVSIQVDKLVFCVFDAANSKMYRQTMIKYFSLAPSKTKQKEGSIAGESKEIAPEIAPTQEEKQDPEELANSKDAVESSLNAEESMEIGNDKAEVQGQDEHSRNPDAE